MDGRTDPLNDAALEREVEALLLVQPSPEFVARVRSRVADESMSSGWGWRWPIAAAAVTATVAVVGVMPKLAAGQQGFPPGGGGKKRKKGGPWGLIKSR